MKINLLSTLLQNSNTIWYTWMTFKTSQVESLRPKTLFKQNIVLYVTLNMWSNCFNWFNYFYFSALTILIVKYITLFRFRMTKRHWLIKSTVSHFSLYYIIIHVYLNFWRLTIWVFDKKQKQKYMSTRPLWTFTTIHISIDSNKPDK